MILTVAVWISTFMLAAAVLLGLWRVWTAPDNATRAIVGDLVYFACVGILIMQGMEHHSTVSVDAAVIAALLGIVATIALARIITRGRR